MTKYNFDKITDRRNSDCIKYDKVGEYFGNPEALPMWVADTDFQVPDFIMNALKKRLNHDILGYSFRPDRYYESIINWMKNHHEWEIEKEWITSSPGVVSALTMLIMALTESGEGVIVQPPVYFPFFTCVKGSGRKMVENPLKLENGRYYFDLEDLKNKIDKDTKLLLLSNPHNPGGMVWTREELKELAEICIENGVVIISDEIHSDLVFAGHKHIPLPSLSKEIAQNCVVCMAPNKTFNIAGLSSAFVIIPNKRMRVKYERMMNVIHVHSGNILGNVATEAAYRHGTEWVNELMDYLENNLKYTLDYFKEKMPKVKVMKPEATFLVWLDFRAYSLSEKAMAKVLFEEAGVALNPGSKFGTGGEGYFRLNIGCPMATLKEGLERIEKTLKKYE